MANGQRTSVEFETVHARELERLRQRRLQANAKAPTRRALVGLALSGGGIRSAAISLGVIQALRTSGHLDRLDYLSTVSGGGYAGACLSVSMSADGGRSYPFGDDVKDSPVVGHIRNFSSYLLPRNRGALQNWGEAAAVILRGLAANAVCVLAFLLALVLLTVIAFPTQFSLYDANFVPRLAAASWAEVTHSPQLQLHLDFDPLLPITFATSLVAAGLLLGTLLIWAALKSLQKLDALTDDGRSLLLALSYRLLVLTGIAIVLDLQPVLIRTVMAIPALFNSIDAKSLSVLLAIATALSTAVGRLGRFLETSRRMSGLRTLLLRGATHVLLFIASCIVPLLLWLSYVVIYAWIVVGDVSEFPYLPFVSISRFNLVLALFVVAFAIMCCLRGNNYSLHWLYRDRIGRAFLVSDASGGKQPADSEKSHPLVDPDVEEHTDIKLSDLQKSSGPYPLINVAINLEGSLEANKRGRNADFFMFSPDYVGSDLTGFVPIAEMERLEPRLDLASAIAISGAAASANMGASTVRLMSPTLALLNIRLGYYLPNPRYVGEQNGWRSFMRRLAGRFYLLNEMFNRLDECSNSVYLTDGGHIENLGVYELLKRGCSTIIAVDAECDPEFGCGSLLRLQQYARIDLGVRITLPWEAIARESLATAAAIASGAVKCDRGPHCAIGRIFYPDKKSGLIVYVKSSLTGDEKDYVLDYARRNPAFPHEGTGDQFFSEEQFEMYRALGFHMLSGLFGQDRIAFLEDPKHGFADEAAARTALTKALA